MGEGGTYPAGQKPGLFSGLFDLGQIFSFLGITFFTYKTDKVVSFPARVHGYLYIHFYKEVCPRPALLCPESGPSWSWLTGRGRGLSRAPRFTPPACPALKALPQVEVGPHTSVSEAGCREGRDLCCGKAHLPPLHAEISAPSNAAMPCPAHDS